MALNMTEKYFLPYEYIYSNNIDNPIVFILLEGTAEIFLQKNENLHFIKKMKVKKYKN